MVDTYNFNKAVSDTEFALKSVGESIKKAALKNMRYVTPCCSDIWDEQGTPVGYYVDLFGNRYDQDTGERIVKANNYKRWEFAETVIPENQPIVEGFVETHDGWNETGWNIWETMGKPSGVIDVTFREVK